MKEAIRRRARELGFDDCRVTTAAAPASANRFQKWLAEGCNGQMEWLARNAEKRVNPQLVLPGAKSLIVLSASYAWPVEPAGQGVGRGHGGPPALVARYARHADYHDVFAGRLRNLADFVDALAGVSGSLWYVDTGPLLERDLAQRAGLGFVGKHTNLVSRTRGNWVLLCEIITRAELEADAPEPNRCGSCTRCITACPTGAITAPFQLDARRCISYLTIELKGSIPVELRPAIGNWIFGCDACLESCPWNRFAKQGAVMKSQRRTHLDGADLIELLSLDEPGFRARFQGTPILRSKRRGLLRNVCVALGNSGDFSAVPALQRAAQDPEPLIAEHAEWAIDQILSRSSDMHTDARGGDPHSDDTSITAQAPAGHVAPLGTANPTAKKAVDPRMHTAEHILTAVVMALLGCGRPFTTHLERKKSKADYAFNRDLTGQEIEEIPRRVNALINAGLPVTEEFLSREEAARTFDLGRVPQTAGEKIRIVRIGDFDACPCIGPHVPNTRQVGSFELVSTSWEYGALRIRFKVGNSA